MRRKFRIRTFIIKILFVFTISACNNSTQSSNRLPNVIIIYTDDQGTIDANCYGAKDLYTPNIDKLADRTDGEAHKCLCKYGNNMQ